MQDELWAGLDRKLANAKFHFEHMWSSVLPPSGRMAAIMESNGQISDTKWQEAFYAYYDAFVSTTRSVAQVLQCCFGYDKYPKIDAWFKTLSKDEQCRRLDFCKQFKPHFRQFDRHPLGTARHVSEHR